MTAHSRNLHALLRPSPVQVFAFSVHYIVEGRSEAPFLATTGTERRDANGGLQHDNPENQ